MGERSEFILDLCIFVEFGSIIVFTHQTLKCVNVLTLEGTCAVVHYFYTLIHQHNHIHNYNITIPEDDGWSTHVHCDIL